MRCELVYCGNPATHKSTYEDGPEYVCGLHSTSDDVPLDPDLSPALRLTVVR